jgi:hypothetical protein
VGPQTLLRVILVDVRHRRCHIPPTSLHPHLRTNMIVLLAILAATRAYPVSLQSPPVLSLDLLHSTPCNDLNNCRSLWDIIRSCALTIFLCTWVSVHPNIPSPEEGWPRVTLRRVGLMLATLVVPEAIIAWALRQRLAAGRLAKTYKGES